jgi:hypothetical protein
MPPASQDTDRAERLARLRTLYRDEAKHEQADRPTHVGIIGALLSSDVSTVRGCASFLGTVGWPDDVTPPTGRQIRLAADVIAKVEAALWAGDAPEIWAMVERAYREMSSITSRRRALVEILTFAFDEAARAHRYAEESPDERGQTLMQLAGDFRRARRALLDVDDSFSHLTAGQLRGILARSNRIGPIGVAVRIALATGALGARVERHEDEDKAFKRVRRLFELALAEAVPESTTEPTIRK